MTQKLGRNDPFSMPSERAMQEELREFLTQPSRHEEDNVPMIGLLIIEGWLAQYRRARRRLGSTDRMQRRSDPVERLADAIAGVVKRSDAHWADEPISALNGQTPRQAIGSATGLERVRGLLRSYEDGEARMAAQQGRAEISYRFLWDELGLQRRCGARRGAQTLLQPGRERLGQALHHGGVGQGQAHAGLARDRVALDRDGRRR